MNLKLKLNKLIMLVGLSLLSTIVHAEAVEKTMMEDYIPVTNREFAFEIVQSKFDKVVLDCGGFLGWMSFYRDGKIAHNIYMDTYSDCPDMHEFLTKAKENKTPVCLQVEEDKLTVSNEPSDCE